MAFGFLKTLLRRRRLDSPEKLIDAVIADMKRRLTETRLQVLAADLARQKLRADEMTDELQKDDEASREGLARLEARLKELETKKALLVARMRDADARLAVERSLMETDQEPAQVALDVLEERVSDSEAEADAVAEVRQVAEQVNGGANG